ncbi:hypothetical protein D3C87_1898710 [compost metagenome]
MVSQGTLLALELVGQETLVIDLACADAVFLDRPIEQVLAVGDHGGGHHRPGCPVGMVVDLVQWQVAPVADYLLA